MPVQPVDSVFGPVRVGALAHARGPGEPVARDWLAGRLGCAAGDLQLVRDAHGRPHLAHADWDCNWSHSGPWLVVALGEGVRVGVDVEAVRPRPRALEIARRYFHPREVEALAALGAGEREAAFLRLWCAKEAVLKAQGRGLAYGLERIAIGGFERADAPLSVIDAQGEVAPAESWTLRALALDGALATVAWRRLPG